MILLDTNVVSELWKAAPDARVSAWANAQAIETLYLSAVTVAELRFGVAALPAGKRRTGYDDRLEREILPAFSGRVLSFDLDASRAYAALMAKAKAAGHAMSMADGYIAAIATAHGLTVATRDGAFTRTGVKAINPWRDD
ncbi:type II toxin-antitoxin system VapC family toxin [Gluconacetobacter sacchari]|uniref:type II toxin-antitoxin system VapC family toxin n=1 Tax=Gluconacetobacter sacchari TaxID=92759 RepID=UPI0039B66439